MISVEDISARGQLSKPNVGVVAAAKPRRPPPHAYGVSGRGSGYSYRNWSQPFFSASGVGLTMFLAVCYKHSYV